MRHGCRRLWPELVPAEQATLRAQSMCQRRVIDKPAGEVWQDNYAQWQLSSAGSSKWRQLCWQGERSTTGRTGSERPTGIQHASRWRQCQKHTVDFLHLKAQSVDFVFAPVPLSAFAHMFPKFAARRGGTMDVGPASAGTHVELWCGRALGDHWITGSML